MLNFIKEQLLLLSIILNQVITACLFLYLYDTVQNIEFKKVKSNFQMQLTNDLQNLQKKQNC